MPKRSFASVLGVSEGASKDEVSRRYKELARKYHPDKNGSAEAQAKFVAIRAAYEQAMTQSPFPLKQWSIEFAQRAETDMDVTVDVTIADVMRGCERIVEIARNKLCTRCFVEGPAPRLCQVCTGIGKLPANDVIAQFINSSRGARTCNPCSGTGVLGRCDECSGKRNYQEKKRYKVTVPPRWNVGDPVIAECAGDQYLNEHVVIKRNVRVFFRIADATSNPLCVCSVSTGDLHIVHTISLCDALTAQVLMIPAPGRDDIQYVPRECIKDGDQHCVGHHGLYRTSVALVTFVVQMPTRAQINRAAVREALLKPP